MWTSPSVGEFKDFFNRDFNFASDTDPDNLEHITNADITRAMLEANLNFNASLYGEDEYIDVVFFYLTAYHLVRNIQLSTKGLSSQAKFPINSNSVGGVSISFSVPEKYSKDPFISQFTHNGYGMKYLEMSFPFLIGNISVARGGSSF